LADLYQQSSKHSNYQLLYPTIEKLLDLTQLDITSRMEKERLDYMIGKLDFNDKTFADIGGNTGYFSFAALDNGAKSVSYYEGNVAHAKFVDLAAKQTNWNNRLTVSPYYINLEQDQLNNKVDVMFLLNVLHHIGDDYGEQINQQGVFHHVENTFNNLANQTQYLIFQLGFNWKGDRNCPIFANGTKSEMIEFVKQVSADNWDIKHIGIAEKKDDNVIYNELNTTNINRDDSLGEFLNRPIFILKSKKVKYCYA
jgi:hypothetical protein